MKKIIALLAAAVALSLCLCACGGGSSAVNAVSNTSSNTNTPAVTTNTTNTTTTNTTTPAQDKNAIVGNWRSYKTADLDSDDAWESYSAISCNAKSDGTLVLTEGSSKYEMGWTWFRFDGADVDYELTSTDGQLDGLDCIAWVEGETGDLVVCLDSLCIVMRK